MGGGPLARGDPRSACSGLEKARSGDRARTGRSPPSQSQSFFHGRISHGDALAQQTPGVSESGIMSPDVRRVGTRLACLCRSCKNTVGDWPMLECGYCGPMRKRIAAMQAPAFGRFHVDAIVAAKTARKRWPCATQGSRSSPGPRPSWHPARLICDLGVYPPLLGADRSRPLKSIRNSRPISRCIERTCRSWTECRSSLPLFSSSPSRRFFTLFVRAKDIPPLNRSRPRGTGRAQGGDL